jgi:hypothetical protein
LTMEARISEALSGRMTSTLTTESGRWHVHFVSACEVDWYRGHFPLPSEAAVGTSTPPCTTARTPRRQSRGSGHERYHRPATPMLRPRPCSDRRSSTGHGVSWPGATSCRATGDKRLGKNRGALLWHLLVGITGGSGRL